MQPETLNRSIQPTPTVHPRGFTPTCVQYWKAANIVTPVFVIGCNPLGLSDDANVMQSITRLTRAQTPSAAPVGAARAAGIPCSTGFLCLTPDNLEGRVYSASLMVGGNGNEVGYAVTTVGATEEVRRRPDLGIGGELTFNINTSTDLSGDYTCCGGTAYPSDANAVVRRLEFTWDYLDATFTVPETAGSEIAGTTHTIRLVYVSEATVGDVRPDTTATLLIGDKLVRSGTASTFSWCSAYRLRRDAQHSRGQRQLRHLRHQPRRRHEHHLHRG